MVPPRSSSAWLPGAAPRACGDGPAASPEPGSRTPCSPRMRGWSLKVDAWGEAGFLLPARAGNAPSWGPPSSDPRTAPRALTGGVLVPALAEVSPTCRSRTAPSCSRLRSSRVKYVHGKPGERRRGSGLPSWAPYLKWSGGRWARHRAEVSAPDGSASEPRTDESGAHVVVAARRIGSVPEQFHGGVHRHAERPDDGGSLRDAAFDDVDGRRRAARAAGRCRAAGAAYWRS